MNLTPVDLQKFEVLGIGSELLEQACVERVTDGEARREYGVTLAGDMSGIVFPYFSPMDGLRRTCRLRRDHPEIERGKPRKKYVVAYGDRRHLYFVPGCAELVNDHSVPVVLVEAEKSALALVAGLNASSRSCFLSQWADVLDGGDASASRRAPTANGWTKQARCPILLSAVIEM